MNVFTLWGEVQIDQDEAIKGLRELDKQGEKTEKGMTKNFGQMTKSVLKWSAIIGAAAAGVVTAISALVKKTASWADEFDKMAIRTGMSRVQLQELFYVASQAGIEFSRVETSLVRLTRSIGEAEMGTERQERAFERLNITLRNNQGELRTSSEIFPELISKLGQMESETERMSLAFELFGRGAAGLVPLLVELGEDGIDELTQKAHELGLVMDDETIAQFVKFEDTVDTLTRTFQAMLRQAAIVFLPFVQDMADWLLEVIPKVSATFSFLGSTIGSTARFISAMALLMGEAFKMMFGWFDPRAILEGWEDFVEDLKQKEWAVPIIDGIEIVFARVRWLLGEIELTKENVTGILSGDKSWADLEAAVLEAWGEGRYIASGLSAFIGIAMLAMRWLWEGTESTFSYVKAQVSSEVKAEWDALKLAVEEARYADIVIHMSKIFGNVLWGGILFMGKVVTDLLDAVKTKAAEALFGELAYRTVEDTGGTTYQVLDVGWWDILAEGSLRIKEWIWGIPEWLATEIPPVFSDIKQLAAEWIFGEDAFSEIDGEMILDVGWWEILTEGSLKVVKWLWTKLEWAAEKVKEVAPDIKAIAAEWVFGEDAFREVEETGGLTEQVLDVGWWDIIATGTIKVIDWIWKPVVWLAEGIGTLIKTGYQTVRDYFSEEAPEEKPVGVDVEVEAEGSVKILGFDWIDVLPVFEAIRTVTDFVTEKVHQLGSAIAEAIGFDSEVEVNVVVPLVKATATVLLWSWLGPIPAILVLAGSTLAEFLFGEIDGKLEPHIPDVEPKEIVAGAIPRPWNWREDPEYVLEAERSLTDLLYAATSAGIFAHVGDVPADVEAGVSPLDWDWSKGPRFSEDVETSLTQSILDWLGRTFEIDIGESVVVVLTSTIRGVSWGVELLADLMAIATDLTSTLLSVIRGETEISTDLEPLKDAWRTLGTDLATILKESFRLALNLFHIIFDAVEIAVTELTGSDFLGSIAKPLVFWAMVEMVPGINFGELLQTALLIAAIRGIPFLKFIPAVAAIGFAIPAMIELVDLLVDDAKDWHAWFQLALSTIAGVIGFGLAGPMGAFVGFTVGLYITPHILKPPPEESWIGITTPFVDVGEPGMWEEFVEDIQEMGEYFADKFKEAWDGIVKFGEWLKDNIAADVRAIWDAGAKLAGDIWDGLVWFFSGKGLWDLIKLIFKREEPEDLDDEITDAMKQIELEKIGVKVELEVEPEVVDVEQIQRDLDSLEERLVKSAGLLRTAFMQAMPQDRLAEAIEDFDQDVNLLIDLYEKIGAITGETADEIREQWAASMQDISEDAEINTVKVADAFKWLRKELVGESDIPEMVDEIDSEWERMRSIVEDETLTMVQRAASLFEMYTGEMGDHYDELHDRLEQASGLSDRFKRDWTQDWDDLEGAVGDATDAVETKWKSFLGRLGSLTADFFFDIPRRLMEPRGIFGLVRDFLGQIVYVIEGYLRSEFAGFITEQLEASLAEMAVEGITLEGFMTMLSAAGDAIYTGAAAVGAALGVTATTVLAVIAVLASFALVIGTLISAVNNLFQITEGIKAGIKEETRSAIDEIREPFRELGRELGQILIPAIREWIPLAVTIANVLSKILIPVFYVLADAIAWLVDGIFHVIELMVEMQNTMIDAIIATLEWLDDFVGKLRDFSDDIERIRKMKWIWERPEVPELPSEEIERERFVGGRQISEITGPTRDLLITLLSPLASLDSLVGIGNRIYNLLDARLGSPVAAAGGGIDVHIDSINITPPAGEVWDEWAAKDLARTVARELQLELRGSGL